MKKTGLIFIPIVILAVGFIVISRQESTVADAKPQEINQNLNAQTGKLITSGQYEIDLSDLGYATEDEKVPAVYFTNEISSDALLDIYHALDRTADGKVGVKIHTGEGDGSYNLDPELIKDLIHEVNGTIVECNTAYGGNRSNTAAHMQIAKDHGYTEIADVDIMDADGSMEIPVEGGSILKSNLVGSHFADYDFYIVLSHFKGHSMGGYGGALKNVAIGMASSEGKSLVHSGGKKHTGFGMGTSSITFTESMAEAVKSVSDYMEHGEKMLFINIMNNISVDCDCVANPSEPDMHDIGILASTDPVALDQACVDLLYAVPDGESVIKRMQSRNGEHILEHAEEIGVGSRVYEPFERKTMRKLALRDEILLQIDKAARYIGGEVNAVMKNKDDVDIRFAMAFPDVCEMMFSFNAKISYLVFGSAV